MYVESPAVCGTMDERQITDSRMFDHTIDIFDHAVDNLEESLATRLEKRGLRSGVCEFPPKSRSSDHPARKEF